MVLMTLSVATLLVRGTWLLCFPLVCGMCIVCSDVCGLPLGIVGGFPASILRKSTSGRHRPVSYPDGPMTARYRFT